MFKKWFYGLVASLLVFVTLGATVAPAFAKTDAATIVATKKVKTNGKPLTVSIGKGGVFMPVTPNNGMVELSTILLSALPRPSNVLVWNGGVDWNVTDSKGGHIIFNANGATVFFNLTTGYAKTALKNHKAVIFYMNKNKWQALPTFAVKGGSRAAAHSVGLGTYALALIK